jgi:hypothetical protein
LGWSRITPFLHRLTSRRTSNSGLVILATSSGSSTASTALRVRRIRRVAQLCTGMSMILRPTVRKLLDMEATEYEPVTARGDSDFTTASVVDPFGNILGVMHNPHYLEVIEAMRPLQA